MGSARRPARLSQDQHVESLSGHRQAADERQHRVARQQPKRRRRFLPNLHTQRFWIESERRWVSLRVSSTACARSKSRASRSSSTTARRRREGLNRELPCATRSSSFPPPAPATSTRRPRTSACTREARDQEVRPEGPQARRLQGSEDQVILVWLLIRAAGCLKNPPPAGFSFLAAANTQMGCFPARRRLPGPWLGSGFCSGAVLGTGWLCAKECLPACCSGAVHVGRQDALVDESSEPRAERRGLVAPPVLHQGKEIHHPNVAPQRSQTWGGSAPRCASSNMNSNARSTRSTSRRIAPFHRASSASRTPRLKTSPRLGRRQGAPGPPQAGRAPCRNSGRATNACEIESGRRARRSRSRPPGR